MTEPDQLVLDILAYFSQNPAAEDSLEGVSAWRQMDPADTRAALDEAVKRQLLVVRKSADGRTLYRLNPEKRKRYRA